jgi:outer membrane receptor protein involved in Fe transport
MRLPTQILLLGAILTDSARADINAPAVTTTATPATPEGVVQLEPVIVTADLWATPLEKLSASVSVVDASVLADQGVRHFGDLADQIPNLTWTGGTSRPRYFQIRGIGENSQFEGETPDSAVQFKIDDFDFTGLGAVGGLFDVSQVEVLRGPQAGAFGANAAGGVVQIVTNAPTPDWQGRVEGTVGTDDLRELGVAAGGTLTPEDPDKLMIRIAAQHAESGGFRRNMFLNRDTNARDEDALRMRLAWRPSDVWRWEAAVLFADLNNGYDEFAMDNNGRFVFSDQPGRDLQRSLGTSLRGEYTGWQEVQLTTITQGTTTDSSYSYDADWTPDASTYGPWLSSIDRTRDTAGQEIRFDSTEARDALGWIDRWTLGAQASVLREKSLYTDPFTRMALRYANAAYGVFGQAGHDITERDRVTFGLRLEQVAVDSRQAARFDDTLVGGKVTYERDVTADQLAYASVARGYKAGGVANDARLQATDPRSYDTEVLWNYELGLRSRMAKGRVLNRASVFWLDRFDTQVRDSAGFGGNFYQYTDNGDRSAVWGLEDEITWLFATNWKAYASLALMDSQLERFTLSNGVDTGGGRELASVPTYGGTLGLRYASSSGWFGHAEMVVRDAYHESNTHAEERSAYEVVNASVGYAWREWSVSLWGRNLLDEVYEKRVFFFDNGAGTQRYESRADPRQVGVSAEYRF